MCKMESDEAVDMCVDTLYSTNQMDTSSIRSDILDHISENNEAHFKSQQCGEPDLTKFEKREIAESLLDRSSSLFLSKYGKYLLNEHLKYFEGSDDYEVNFYLNECKKQMTASENKSQVRNRRLEALRRLCQKSEYFTDLEMKRRNPLMYEELVGQYLTDEEKIQSEASQATDKTFSSLFFDIVERDIMNSKLKKEIETDYNEMDETDKEEVKPKHKLWGEIVGGGPKSGPSIKVLNNSRHESITDYQKALLFNEFRSRVYSDFLVGKDSEFDYSQVDGNTDYDDLNMLESDQQDSYFDSETPKMVYDEDSNSTSDM